MKRYQFDGFVLDVEARELSRDGEKVVISPRALDALIYLVCFRERPVETNELLAKVWGVEALSPSSVPTCIAAIRRALRDDAAAPHLIATVRGRGYRFIATAREIPTVSDRSGANPWLIGLGVAAAIAIPLALDDSNRRRAS